MMKNRSHHEQTATPTARTETANRMKTRRRALIAAVMNDKRTPRVRFRRHFFTNVFEKSKRNVDSSLTANEPRQTVCFIFLTSRDANASCVHNFVPAPTLLSLLHCR